MKIKFEVGQRKLWIIQEFDGRTVTPCQIAEIHSDHVIAKTEDGMTLWIDESNEMQFFDVEIMNKIGEN